MWVGLAMLVVGIAAGIGFAVYGTVVIVDELQFQAGVKPGTSGTVNVPEAGCRDLYLLASGGSLPSGAPTVTVRNPSGDDVTVSSSGCDANSSQATSTSFKIIGSFTASTPGAYTLQVGSVSGAGTSEVVAGPPFTTLATKIAVWFGLAFVVGGLLALVGLIVMIVGLVRRSRARRALLGPPPGAWGGPGPGGPGGPGGGWGAPPGGAPTGPPSGPSGAPPSGPYGTPPSGPSGAPPSGPYGTPPPSSPPSTPVDPWNRPS
ncbi:MAG: hypothetical protein R2726_01875 [Acidimicrobiales bacterium]